MRHFLPGRPTCYVVTIKVHNVISYRDLPFTNGGHGNTLYQALLEANEWLSEAGIEALDMGTLRHFYEETTVPTAEVGLCVWYIRPTKLRGAFFR